MSEAVKHLQIKLREMIEADRVQIVDYYTRIIRGGLEQFLKARQPNKTIYDVYKDYNGPIGIKEATNYWEAYRGLGWQSNQQLANRPAFNVVFLPNADEVIHGLAIQEVEAMILTFLSRATEKLGPIVERKEGIEMTKISKQAGFRSGAWVGCIEFKFDDETHFTSEMKVITNFTKYGRPFGQYPMTFHAVKLTEQEVKGMCSIEDIWASIGYIPPPPVERPRWTKVIGGSVIVHNDQVIFISVPSDMKKLNIPENVKQIARVVAYETSCRCEYADGRIEKYKYTEEDVVPFKELEKEYKHNKANAARREFAFRKFFACEGE